MQCGGHVLEVQVQQGAKAYVQEVCLQAAVNMLNFHGLGHSVLSIVPAAKIGSGGVSFQGGTGTSPSLWLALLI